MKYIFSLFAFVIITSVCKAQNEDRIYAFMNNELPPQEIGKSWWGIFLLAHPAILDSSNCEKIIDSSLKNIPPQIRQEFYQKCLSQDAGWQNRFRWDQKKLTHVVVVADANRKISTSAVSGSTWTNADIKNAFNWIKEWNQSAPGDRLVNYTSIPLFSDDQQYVLILRGQSVENEGGWDTIYFYKKVTDGWTIADKIIVTEL